jgi:hypothetical protein
MGNMLFATRESVPVLTQGSPSHDIELLVE